MRATFKTRDGAQVTVEGERLVPISQIKNHPEQHHAYGSDHDDTHKMGSFRAEHGGIERYCLERGCDYGERLVGRP